MPEPDNAGTESEVGTDMAVCPLFFLKQQQSVLWETGKLQVGERIMRVFFCLVCDYLIIRLSFCLIMADGAANFV